MKHMKLFLALMLLLLNGCSQTSKTNQIQSTETSIIVTDMKGREVTIDEPVTSVVALTASDCEILYAIGAGDLLVGRGEYCDYPLEVLDVTVVESGANTNIEQIIDLNPQVVILGTMTQTKEQVDSLEEAGIKVIVTEAKDIEGVYTSIELIGKVMGKESEATSVISDMKSTFEEISSKANKDDIKTVYFEVSPLEYGLWTAGSDTFMNEICEMLGLKNIFEDIVGWGEISEEQVLQRNPDYIVTISMYFGEGPNPIEEIMSRKGWEDITAVKNKAILNLSNNELSRPVPRLVDGARMMFDFIYGQ